MPTKISGPSCHCGPKMCNSCNDKGMTCVRSHWRSLNPKLPCKMKPSERKRRLKKWGLD